jgi:hypothetical protein
MTALVLFEACSYIDEEGVGVYGRRLFKKKADTCITW